MKTRTTAILPVLLLAVLGAAGEDLVLFSAANAGADVWSWGEARIERDGALLNITERNRTGDYGDVFVSDRLAYLPGGLIKMDVKRVLSGGYTLQVLAFKGDSHVATADVVKDSIRVGPQILKLGATTLPEDTEAVVFKIWVAGMEGAGILLRELKYYLPIDDASVLMDLRVDPTTSCAADNVLWTPAAGGGTMALPPEFTYGSVLFPQYVDRDGAETLVLHTTDLRDGSITAQVVAFDEQDTYLDSRDVLKRVESGLKTADLGTLEWPEGTVKFRVKLWLEGTEGCSAVIRRVLVVK